MDMAHSSKLYVGGLLERGIRVLVYVGMCLFWGLLGKSGRLSGLDQGKNDWIWYANFCPP